MNIYEIADNYLTIQRMLEDGEIDIDTFNDTLESIEFDLHEKADNYAKLIKNIESDINGLKDEEKRLADKRRALENKVLSLKKNLEHSMVLVDDKKFKTDLFSFNVQKNAPSLEVVFEEKIPEEYYIPQAPKLDRKELLKAVKGGLEVEGVGIKQTESLRIK
jgi:hypothetical protein